MQQKYVVSGSAESLDVQPGRARLTLKKRTGFARIAIETGSDLVPVFTFGENEMFYQVDNPRGSWLRFIQETLKTLIGMSPTLFWGVSIKGPDWGFLLMQVPLTSVVGRPIKALNQSLCFLLIEGIQYLIIRYCVTCSGLLAQLLYLQSSHLYQQWCNSLDKISETSLPPIKCFYNKLRNTLPSETEYGHAVKVWKEKQLASFGDNYRSLLMTKNNMELLNYVSVAQISYQNILKNCLKHDLRTKPRFFGTLGDDFYKKLNSRSDLVLILGMLKRYRSAEESDDPYTMHLWSQIDPIDPNVAYKPCLLATTPTKPSQKMYNLISDSIYGGRCEVFKRYAEESNGMIMGLDENKLYGWAMMQKLPYGNMTLHTDRVFCTNLLGVLNNVSKQQQQLPYNQRYMYGVMHKLNQEQREFTKNFPPLAEKIQLDESVQVSGYMDYLKTQLKTEHNKTTLQTRKTLKYLLENNLCCINDIYEVIEQPIDYVLKDYVEDMTANRQKAENGIFQGKQTSDDNLVTKSSSEKEFFKLMVNSGFGKMLQSDDKYNKSLLLHSPESFMKQTIGRTITDWSIMRHKGLQRRSQRSNLNDLAKRQELYATFSKSHFGLLTLQDDALCSETKQQKRFSSILGVLKRYRSAEKSDNPYTMHLWSQIDPIPNVAYKPCLLATTPRSAIVNLLYTDADSIYMQAKVSSYEEFKQRFPDHLQKIHFAATGDITPGKMNLECELKEAMFVKPKTYSYVKDDKEDVRNKGVVLSQDKEIFDNKRAVFSDDLLLGPQDWQSFGIWVQAWRQKGLCCAQHLTSLTNWKTRRKVSENSATKKHIQCMFIEKEHLGFLWFEIILYKQRLIELFGSYVVQVFFDERKEENKQKQITNPTSCSKDTGAKPPFCSRGPSILDPIASHIQQINSNLNSLFLDIASAWEQLVISIHMPLKYIHCLILAMT
ncbi:2-acylglycerol O-acyltransferase 2-A-like [Planoprotostelium fungivorum]|uniref:2-acylglycerol O-acyltransferase 2-A-like n=1 Tax=Planoprotostelium fungivorum TaxID=1890364 RepID=A0A2P6N7A3_9EUKA|nr:2-acylglycerol O-acyltransferase 2-A-like [Planoprotostelium fungivorum]